MAQVRVSFERGREFGGGEGRGEGRRGGGREEWCGKSSHLAEKCYFIIITSR